MNKEAYLKFHREACDKLVEITRAKNADYTGAGDDPFANFSRVEQLGICSAETGFLTRLTDKFSRIASFVEKGTLEVKDESFEDTCFDLANYAILLAGYVRSKKEQTKPGLKVGDKITVVNEKGFLVEEGSVTAVRPPVSLSPQIICECGHLKSQHIYEEGACRPGYICAYKCQQFKPLNTPGLQPSEL